MSTFAVGAGPSGHQRGAEMRAQIQHPKLKQLFDYWDAVRGRRRFPGRRDIDPVDFRYAVGNVTLVEILQEPLRFHVRLHGSNIAERAGFDLTGKTLSDIPGPESRAFILKRCHGLVVKGEPQVAWTERVFDGFRRRYEVLWLPLSQNGESVNMLMCALYCQQQPIRAQ